MALRELSEDELLERYGGLIWSAVSAFGEDPSYLGDMASAANQILYKRALWAARAEATQKAESPDDVRDLTREILAQRGVHSPRSTNRAA